MELEKADENQIAGSRQWIGLDQYRSERKRRRSSLRGMTLNRVGADCVVDVSEQILINELICIHVAARSHGSFIGKSLAGLAVKVKVRI